MTTAHAITNRLREARSLLRLRPFDTDTVEGRSKERYRRMLLSTAASMTARIISVSTALISVPLALHYLGAERYGVWVTISSFLAVLAFADLGIGNGLLGQMAAAHGRRDDAAMREAVASAFGILSLIGVVILGLFWVIYPIVPWHRLFNVTDPLAMAEAGPAIAVFAVCFAFSIPATVVQRVQVGLQQSFVSSLWLCLSSILALTGVILATRLELGLPWLVLAMLGTPLCVSVVNGLIFFLRDRPDLLPRFSNISIAAAGKTMNTGLLFLLLQLVGALSFASDPILITHLLGPEAVPQYSVPERMFALVAMVVSMALAPLWPAYGEAIGRGDHAWVRTTLFRSIGLAVGFAAIGSCVVALAAPTLLLLWVGSAVQATPLLLAGLAVWKVLEASGVAVAMYLNGAHVVRFQVVVATLFGLAAISLKILLLPMIGVAGVPVATAASYFVLVLIPYGWFLLFRSDALARLRRQPSASRAAER